MSEPKKKNRTMLQTIILAAVSLIIGLVLVIWPNTSSKVIAYVLAGLITLAGLVHIILEYFRGSSFLPFSGLASGLTVLSIGIFLLIRVDVLEGVLAIVLGIFLIYLGFVMLETALKFLKAKAPKWWLPGAFALVTLVLGFLSLFNVFPSITLFLGISLIVESVLLIVSLILFGKNGTLPESSAAPQTAPAPEAPQAAPVPEAPAPETAGETPAAE